MQWNLMVFTESQTLLDQVRQHLSLQKGFKIHHADNQSEAINLTKQVRLDLVILDTGLMNVSFQEFTNSCKELAPGLRWLVLPPEEENAIFPFLGFLPDGILSRPIDQSEMIEQIESLINQNINNLSLNEENDQKILFDIPPPDPILVNTQTSQGNNELLESDPAWFAKEQVVKPQAPINPWLQTGQYQEQLYFQTLDQSPAQEYTVVLKPRNKKHALTGKVEKSLYEWLTQASLIHNWQLKTVKIRPDCIFWVMRIPPEIPPGDLIKITRHYTSIRIRSLLSTESESDSNLDFWASEYLLIPSSEPLDPEYIQEFTNQNTNQG